MLEPAAIEDFVRDGYVVVRGAVPTDVIARCQDEIATELAAVGVDVFDRATWQSPVVCELLKRGDRRSRRSLPPRIWAAIVPNSHLGGIRPDICDDSRPEGPVGRFPPRWRSR